MTFFDRNKISNQTEVFHLRFDRNFDYLPVNWDWAREFFENGMASFGRTGANGQRGPPLEVDYFFCKIFTWTEVFH